MNKEEQDLLWARLDERTANIWRVVEQLEKHNAEQNGFIQEALIRTKTNRIWIRLIIGTGSTLILVATAILTKIGGLW